MAVSTHVWGECFHDGSTAGVAARGGLISAGSVGTAERHLDFNGNGSANSFLFTATRSIYETGSITPYVATPRFIGFYYAFRPDGGGPTTRTEAQFFDSAGTAQFTVAFNYFTRLVNIYRGASTFIQSSAATISVGGHWVTIELDAANSGACTVKIDGATYIAYTGDTQASGTPGWAQVKFDDLKGDTTGGITDVVATDSSFGEPPECYGIALYPASDVSTGFTGVPGSPNYANIDEIPFSTTDYNETASAGTVDKVNLTSLPYTPTSVLFEMVEVYAAKDGSMTGVDAGIQSSATTEYAATDGLGASAVYSSAIAFWDLNPATGAAWTPSAVNSQKLAYRSA